ncbi:DUF2569 family protein [Acidovorax sp.]|uniref:DUF2569 family protein n=1 Tax=Acidovorax sp. TaxID=1872122 RepID=UPI003D06F894
MTAPQEATPFASQFEAGAVDVRVYPVDTKVAGVYGWLRFLCLMLGFLNPLFVFSNIRAEYAQLAPIYAKFPQFRALFAVEATTGTLTAVLGMAAAWMLWKRFAGAVICAKVYLVAVVLMAILQLVVFTSAQGFTPEVMSVLQEEGIRALVRAFFGCALWYCYLQYSSRVRLTYSEGSALGPLRKTNISPVAASAGLVLLTFVLYWLYHSL